MKYKYYELDPEEEEILKAFEEGKLVRVKNFNKEKKLLEEAARRTLNKTKNINIRLSERDLLKLKAKAAREGIPYQTLASSILHKATT
ncbi:MAG: hypothetical protein ACD_37C00158G0003 [uncultured bacterium]|nr:MAG: hypothetical protein ACD_37C00158G0003 [uncultured bacterium]